MTNTTTATIVTDVVALLIEAGWRRRWPSCENAATCPAGSVALHLRDGDDAVTVELEAAGTSLVETLTLDPTAGPARIARIIIAATEEPTT